MTFDDFNPTWEREASAIQLGACTCLTCTQERVDADPIENPGSRIFDQRLCKMFLCPLCGNKRCPRAHDHRNTCTNSNEPGQKGSGYE